MPRQWFGVTRPKISPLYGSLCPHRIKTGSKTSVILIPHPRAFDDEKYFVHIAGRLDTGSPGVQPPPPFYIANAGGKLGVTEPMLCILGPHRRTPKP
jgi:hypothetical protein